MFVTVSDGLEGFSTCRSVCDSEKIFRYVGFGPVKDYDRYGVVLYHG